MLNIDISFRNQDALTQFVVPQLIGKFCMGCKLDGRCLNSTVDRQVSIRSNHVRWQICVHSSCLSDYLCEVLELNSSLRKFGIIKLKCFVWGEPEDNLLYADICISNRLMKDLLCWDVQEIEVVADSGMHAVSTRRMDFDVRSHIWDAQFAMTGLLRRESIGAGKVKSPSWCLHCFCRLLALSLQCQRDGESCWIFIESCGTTRERVCVTAGEIKILLFVNATIEVACIR